MVVRTHPAWVYQSPWDFGKRGDVLSWRHFQLALLDLVREEARQQLRTYDAVKVAMAVSGDDASKWVDEMKHSARF